MLQTKREHLAGLATQRVAGLFQESPGPFYVDSVQQKLTLLLQAVDRAALAATQPILFAGILPGFDLVIMRNPDLATTASANAEPLDPRTVSAVDESCLALLGRALTQVFAERATQGFVEEEGAFIFDGGDGLHYFGFKTLYRQAVLKEMGVSESGLVSYLAPSGVLQ